MRRVRDDMVDVAAGLLDSKVRKIRFVVPAPAGIQ
jgi:hypothetical protein